MAHRQLVRLAAVSLSIGPQVMLLRLLTLTALFLAASVMLGCKAQNPALVPNLA
jgi:hypothetical protein